VGNVHVVTLKPCCSCSCCDIFQFQNIVLLSCYLVFFSYLVWTSCGHLCSCCSYSIMHSLSQFLCFVIDIYNVSCNSWFLRLAMFSKDLFWRISYSFTEGVGEQGHVNIFVNLDGKLVNDANLQMMQSLLQMLHYIRILEFLNVKCYSCVIWFVADPLQVDVDEQVMTISNMCSWKVSCTVNIHTCAKGHITKMYSLWLWCFFDYMLK